MYEIIYLPTARKQLEDIVDYIAVELAAPDAALDFIEEVGKATKSLQRCPTAIRFTIPVLRCLRK